MGSEVVEVQNKIISKGEADLLSLLCFISLLAVLVVLVKGFFQRKESKKIELKFSVVKNRFFFVYIPAILLFYLGLVYNANKSDVLFFLESITRSVKLIGLDFNTDKISTLMSANGYYKVTVICCFFLVIFNNSLFVLSLFHRRVSKWWNFLKWKLAAKKILIIGNNPNNIEIYSSVIKKNTKKSMTTYGTGILSDRLTEEAKSALYAVSIPFFDFNEISPQKQSIEYFPMDLISLAIKRNEAQFINEKKITAKILNIKGKNSISDRCSAKYKFCVIINTESDEKNISVCREICKAINDYIDKVNSRNDLSSDDVKKLVVGLFSLFQVYVFGAPKYEALYFEIVNESQGVIRYMNKYTQIAIDFIQKHPITEFMTEKHIDTERFLLRKDVNINVLLIGFGKTNQQIFLTSVANNQFIEMIKDKNGNNVEALRPVKYHIFDKEESEKNKNLNHNYYRYRNEFFTDKAVEELKKASICGKTQDNKYEYPISCPYDNEAVPIDEAIKYLPLPMLPAEEYYHHLDINDTLFYNTMKGIVSENENNINYIVIAFSTDLENIDLARKIYEKCNEWEIDNVYIFVKVRTGVSNSSIFDNKHYFLIGDEKNVVYNLANIKCSEIMKMALKRNAVYESGNISKDELINNQYKWYVKKTQIERDSNVYAALSLRSKLHMMGLDYVDYNSEGKEITPEEYYEIYGKGDKPLTDMVGNLVYPDNPTDYICSSPRHIMAVQEHYRWNSYMISKGLIPSTIQQIKEDGGKHYELRRHGNLTTYAGLIEFYNLKGYDVIRYDYELLDCAFSFINDYRDSSGNRVFKIIKKDMGKKKHIVSLDKNID